MRKTIYRSVTVYVKQAIEYESKADLEDKIAELENRICLDIGAMQDGGCSEYDYHIGSIDSMKKSDFPHWMFK